MNPISTTPGTLNPDLHCSLCGGPLMVYPIFSTNGVQAGVCRGVKVRCENTCVPNCHENPEGFGNNAKAAYEILCQKYQKSKTVITT